jgi:hypothetical protein
MITPYCFPVWKEADKEIPVTRKPILMKGPSGYIEPNQVLYVSGYYDSDYRPRSPWIDSQGTCVIELGLVPTHWCYVDLLEKVLGTNLGEM